MNKKTLFLTFGVVFSLFVSVGVVSAYDFFESFRFTQSSDGFSLDFDTSVPQFNDYSYVGCPYKDFSSDGRKCARTLALVNPRAHEDNFVAYRDARNRYSLDPAIKQAFKTHERIRLEELRNERAAESERNRYRYSSFGYSGRYFRYGF